MGDPWGDLGALLGALGVLLGALGALLGALEPLLSALGVLSGLSWVPLAPNGGPQSSWIRFSTAFCHSGDDFGVISFLFLSPLNNN